MSEENINAAAQETAPAVELNPSIVLSEEVREAINKKAEELKAQYKLHKVFVIIVEGEDDSEKPLYIGYFKRPGLMHFSQYMNFVQKDFVQANKMLATNVFLAGDRELIDDEDLFLYGAMQQVAHLIDSRNADLVKK